MPNATPEPPPRDPQLGGVTPAKAEAWARAHGRSVREGLKVLAAALARETQRRQGDPFAFGYEPPIWFVASALLEGSPVTPAMEARVRARTGLDWPTFAERMRRACGFDRPVRELLIMGANRSGKTDWAAKRLVRRLTAGRNEQLVVGAQTRETSRSTQQDRVWHYLPKDLRARNGERGNVFYLNHKDQTGFTFNKVTMDDHSNLRFVTYEQDVNAIMEGPAFDEGWLDEEFGKRWLDALRFRLSSKRGTLIATFTPVSGYTPVVADFLEGMVVTRRTTAYLLPRDGGPPLPWAQLGLSEAEWHALTGAHSASDGGLEEPRGLGPVPPPPAATGLPPGCGAAPHQISQASKPPVQAQSAKPSTANFQASLQPPESRPEDCFRWLEDAGPFSEPENVAPGRVFETVPRVARKRDGSAAILWFLGRDNPYGAPGRVIEVAAGNVRAEESIRRRVYGLATQTRGGRFRFDPKRHVAPDSALPPLLARTMVVDPAPERNWFCLWLGVDDKGDVWVYREWPGDYEIPGQGVPGDWAVVSDRRNGINDGDRGPAQEKFGFGLDKYKAEWARLEGWEDAARWAASGERKAENGMRGGEAASLPRPRNALTGDGEAEGAWGAAPPNQPSLQASKLPNFPFSACPGAFPRSEEIATWAAENGTREPLRRRILDSRAGSQSKISFGEDKTLLELCLELCPDFQPASGRRIGAGEELINALLDPAPGGRALHVLQSCKNTLFALARHTGADGQKGADKEPIDCLRYALESGLLDDRPDPALDAPTAGPGAQPRPNRPQSLEMDYCD